jgi:hypothetical protein
MPLIMLLHAFHSIIVVYGAQVVQVIPRPHKSICELLGVCFVAEDPKEREHLRQILSEAAPKLSLIKLRHGVRSQDEGVNRLKDKMT